MEQPEVPGLEPGNGSVIPGQLVLDSKENSQDIGNKRQCFQDLSGGAVDKNPPANVGTQLQSLVWENSTCRQATKTL